MKKINKHQLAVILIGLVLLVEILGVLGESISFKKDPVDVSSYFGFEENYHFIYICFLFFGHVVKKYTFYCYNVILKRPLPEL